MLKRALGALLIAVVTTTAALAQDDLAAEAQAALTVWFDASAAGDLDALDAILAPEFQILRSNGVGFSKEEYIDGNQPNLIEFTIEDVIATRTGDIMVARYLVVVDETIGGAAVEARSPRLTVMRYEDGDWLIVSHANFAQIED